MNSLSKRPRPPQPISTGRTALTGVAAWAVWLIAAVMLFCPQAQHVNSSANSTKTVCSQQCSSTVSASASSEFRQKSPESAQHAAQVRGPLAPNPEVHSPTSATVDRWDLVRAIAAGMLLAALLVATFLALAERKYSFRLRGRSAAAALLALLPLAQPGSIPATIPAAVAPVAVTAPVSIVAGRAALASAVLLAPAIQQSAHAAMFLLGCEETPWAGSDFSGGLSKVGHRLMLPSAAMDDMSTATNWSGTPTYEWGRMAIIRTSSGASIVNYTPSAGNTMFTGDFCIRVDFDQVNDATDNSGAGGDALRFGWTNASSNYVQVRYNTSFSTLVITGASQAGIATSPQRFGTLELSRSGNVFTGRVWNNQKQAWDSLGTTTQASYTGGGTIGFTATTSGATPSKIILSNFRSCFPTVTSGSWESADLDTVDGYGGIWWKTTTGTGTVTVQVKTASTQAGLTSATYTTTANDTYVTRSTAARWAKVKVTISGASLTAAAPEVGPIFVDGSADQAFYRSYARQVVATMAAHTDSNYRLAMNEAVGVSGAITAHPGRAAQGIAQYLVDGGSDTITWKNSSTSISTLLIEGYNQVLTDMAGYDQIKVESATVLPAIYQARAILNPLISNGRKASWVNSVNGKIGAGAGNWHVFGMQCRAALNGLFAYDSNWQSSAALPYATSTIDTHWTALMALYAGNGIFADDAGTTGAHYDSYSGTIALGLGSFSKIMPSYSKVTDGSIDRLMTAHRKNVLAITDKSTIGNYLGRSVGSSAGVAINTALYKNTGWGHAREMLGRSLSNSFRYRFIYEGGFFQTPLLSRTANPSSAEGYISWGAGLGGLVSGSLSLYNNTAIWSAAAIAYPGETASQFIWPEGGIAVVKGSGANSPLLRLDAANFDLGSYLSKYASRISSQLFGINTNQANNQPDPNGGFFWFRDAGYANNLNRCSLQQASSFLTILGGKSVIQWRTGTAIEQDSTYVNGNATVTPMTDVVVAKGSSIASHALTATKVELGARTATFLTISSPPIPLGTGATATNTTTSSTPASAYQEAPNGTLSIMATSLSGNIETTATNAANLLEATRYNRQDLHGTGVSLTTASSVTGTTYAAVDFALYLGRLATDSTLSTERTFWSSYTRSGDVITSVADGENIWVAFTGQSSGTAGSWTIASTGSGAKGFSGQTGTSPTYWGGGDLTSVSHSTLGTLATATTACNMRGEILSPTATRIQTTGALTINAAFLPTGFAQVLAYDSDGNQVNVTSRCTINAGTSVVIPSDVVSDYKFGVASFDVTTGTFFRRGDTGRAGTRSKGQ